MRPRAFAARVVRTEALRVVVERRQVEERDVARERFLHCEEIGEAGVPGLRVRDRPPVAVQRERAVARAERGVRLRRLRVAVEDRAALVLVDVRRRDEPVDRLAEALLEEEHPDGVAAGARGGPDPLPADEPRGLLPERRPPKRARPRAVADHAVLPRGDRGAEPGLRGAGDRREDRPRRAELQPGQPSEPARLQIAPAQAGDRNDEVLHGARRAASTALRKSESGARAYFAPRVILQRLRPSSREIAR